MSKIESVKDYKNVGVRVQAPNNSPLGRRDDVVKTTSKSFTSPMDAKPYRHVYRVPVVCACGKALMPCKRSKARKLFEGKQAVGEWLNGIYYLRMLREVGHNVQGTCLGVDGGSKFSGLAILTSEEVNEAIMLILPDNIAKKIELRRIMRRNRRYRKCGKRKQTGLNNRHRKEFWIAPSQKVKVDFLLKSIGCLKKLYPIDSAVYEDVKFNHYKKKWGKYFSTTEIGKTRVKDQLKIWFKDLYLLGGFETNELRNKYGVKKSSDKTERSFKSHCVDAAVIAAEKLNLKSLIINNETPFHVWKRYVYPRRQLHVTQPIKGGVRKRFGGSRSGGGLRKGDIVIWKNQLCRVGGYQKNNISIHEFNVDNKRIRIDAKAEDCKRLFSQRIMF